MKSVMPGDHLSIPVSVQTGAFPTESLITIETIDGDVSGFIQSREIRTIDGLNFIGGVVLEVSERSITVRLPGSFFTTTGIADISHSLGFKVAA